MSLHFDFLIARGEDELRGRGYWMFFFAEFKLVGWILFLYGHVLIASFTPNRIMFVSVSPIRRKTRKRGLPYIN